MGMQTTEQQLKRIQEKLQQLLKQHTAIQKENARLKEELTAAEAKVSLQQKNADELKQQVSILKLNAGEMSAADKKEFEKRLNSYIKEIDRCISLLGE
jgi:predicted nuclease with TOPRIM domain